MKYFFPILFFLFAIVCSSPLPAQEKVNNTDSVPEQTARKKDSIKSTDSVTSPVNHARKAALRSAILPGWGQAYNKKYWKIPIVYAALGTTGYIFADNIKTYREYRFAYAARIKADPNYTRTPDSTDYNKLKQIYKIISPESIKSARDEFRRYIDYSVLFFIVFWGLNVVDATVDAHLREFDISPDLSLKIKPSVNPQWNTAGVSLVFNIGKNHSK